MLRGRSRMWEIGTKAVIDLSHSLKTNMRKKKNKH